MSFNNKRARTCVYLRCSYRCCFAGPGLQGCCDRDISYAAPRAAVLARRGNVTMEVEVFVKEGVWWMAGSGSCLQYEEV